MSESLWWKSVGAASETPALTEELMLSTIRKMMEPRPYIPHVQHLVSPNEHARGWGVCIECGAMVGDWPEWALARAEAAMDGLLGELEAGDAE